MDCRGAQLGAECWFWPVSLDRRFRRERRSAISSSYLLSVIPICAYLPLQPGVLSCSSSLRASSLERRLEKNCQKRVVRTNSKTFWVDSWSIPRWLGEEGLGNVRAPKVHTAGRKSGNGPLGTCPAEYDADFGVNRRDHQYTWTSLISDLVKRGQGRQALIIYEEKRPVGAKPSSYTLVAALRACSCLQDLESARKVHADAIKRGLELDAHVGTTLIDVYVKCGSLADARNVFERMPQRDVICWTAMIHGYTQMEEPEAALQLYALMQQEGVAPNDRTFVCALKACSSLAALREGDEASRKRCLERVRGIHFQIVQMGFDSALFIGTMLIDVYAKCGRLVDARFVFDRMSDPNVVSWTAMIMGYASMDEGEEALKLYVQMQQQGVVPNERTFVAALKGCCAMATSTEGNCAYATERSLQHVRAIHLQVVESGYECAVFVGTMLVDAYAKCGSLVDARHMFDRMSRRDVVTWNAMILGYAQMEDGEVVLDLYARMQLEGIAPNVRTFVAVLKACAVVAGLATGRKIHSQISRLPHIANDLFVAASLVDMYFKCGSLKDALDVFNALPSRDVVTWNALISGYTYHGESELVFQSFERMKEDGVQPNGATLLSLLAVCSHVGLVEKGREYFDTMHDTFGISPTNRHYTCVIDLLGRSGDLDTMMATVRAMPFEPDGAVWQSVLCACRKWCNVELGRLAFDSALRLDQHDAAAYVLMSNIYAAARMWDEARQIERVTRLTLQSRPWKQSGRSWWTDEGGSVHAFLVEDREQARSLEVHRLLQDLRSRWTSDRAPYKLSIA